MRLFICIVVGAIDMTANSHTIPLVHMVVTYATYVSGRVVCNDELVLRICRLLDFDNEARLKR